MVTDFISLGIKGELVDILSNYGIKQPTPIQEQSIPLIRKGRDVIGHSQTGTGKTLAFALPMVQKIKKDLHLIQALIITPTRELAIQITEEMEKLAEPLGINVLSIYGGRDIERQKRGISGHPQIVIGTPGRILDHLKKRTITFGKVEMLVLDEADQMIKLGFLEEVEVILSQTPPSRQTMLFSATIPKGIRSLVAKYMRKPTEVRIHTKNVTLDAIKQIAIETTEGEKEENLVKLMNQFNPYLAMVFCISKERVIKLNEALIQRGFMSDELHGEMSQSKREQVMKKFRSAKLQILVATDIAARGLDIEGVTHVFNYDVPKSLEYYIHRIGRTGRAGEEGTAVTLVTQEEMESLRKIEAGIGTRLERWTDENQDRLMGDKLDTFVLKRLEEKKVSARTPRPRSASGGPRTTNGPRAKQFSKFKGTEKKGRKK